MFKAAAKLRLNHRLDDLARHSPVRERDPEDLPGFNLPRSYAAEPILFSIVAPLDPSFVNMPLHKDGESLPALFRHSPFAAYQYPRSTAGISSTALSEAKAHRTSRRAVALPRARCEPRARCAASLMTCQ